MENKNTYNAPGTGSFKEVMSSTDLHSGLVENTETYKPINKKVVDIKKIPKFNEVEDISKILPEQPFDLKHLGETDHRVYKFLKVSPRTLLKNGNKAIQWVYKEPGSDVWLEPVKTLPLDEIEIINEKINKRIILGNLKK